MQERRDAFVVWLDPEPPDRCEGQVEHVGSATRARFRDADELLRFLEAHRRRDGPPPER